MGRFNIARWQKEHPKLAAAARRKAARSRSRGSGGHLYRGKGGKRARRAFEREYGKERGDYIYGATVGKVKREREGTWHPDGCRCDGCR